MKNKKQKNKKFSFMMYIWRHRYAFLFYVLGLTGFYIGNILTTIYAANALASVTNADYNQMLWQLGYALIASLVGRIASLICDYAYARMSREISTEMRRDLTERIFMISSKSFGENSAGMFVNRIAYSPDEAIGKISDLVDTLGAIVSSFVTVIYIMFLNFYVGLLIFGVIILLVVLEYFKVRAYSRNKTRRKKAHDDIVSLSNEVVRSEKDIKSLNLEEKLRMVSAETFDKFKKASYKEYLTDVKFWTTRHLILELFAFGLIAFSLYLLEGGFIVLSAFLFIFMNRSTFSHVVWNIGRVITCTADIRVENFRMKEIFNDENFPTEKFGDVEIEPKKVKGKVTFKNVYFGYEDLAIDSIKKLNRDIMLNRKKYKEFLKEQEQLKKDRLEGKVKKKEVIKNMSFTIPAGKTTAFVGRSGSGKSTILSLIPKLYEVDKGVVSIDGVDVKKLSKKTLRESISLVNQFPYIFNASIKENLLMANKDATDEMIRDALKKASLLEFVDGLTNGMETIVGENGIKLSGGQKQRLAIARALLKESKIIIFDESTSSLDNFAQEDVRKSIEALQNKTVVIVAHRLSTIRHADIIFFLEDGKIIGKGTFNELFENNEKFRDMFVAENIK